MSGGQRQTCLEDSISSWSFEVIWSFEAPIAFLVISRGRSRRAGILLADLIFSPNHQPIHVQSTVANNLHCVILFLRSDI